jgi:hypothetical protein
MPTSLRTYPPPCPPPCPPPPQDRTYLSGDRDALLAAMVDAAEAGRGHAGAGPLPICEVPTPGR